MGEEDAMKKEKKIKSKSKKGKKVEEAPIETRESHNICAVDAEMKKDLKKNKTKKIKKSKKAESVIKKGSEEGESTAAYGEDRAGVPLDNVEMKMKRREMNETSHTKEAGENERKSGEDVSKAKNTRDDCKKKKKKKHKVKRKLEDVYFDKDGELDGKEPRQRIQNCERKKRKMEKKKSKEDSSSPNKRNKTVRFSGKDEVFSILGDSSIKTENVGEDGLLRGKRFTPEEDETIKAAVSHYIEKNDLGDEGLAMVLSCSKYPKIRGCWKEIGNAIPYRPYMAVYNRAQNLYHRSELRKWTQEEYDLLRSYQKEHGNKWKPIAEELGKHFVHVSDAWRRIKLDTNKGRWSQDEYQKLFNLVNLDLQAKLCEEKKSRHGMLRDNICWKEVSDVLSTRSHKSCCVKWYKQLTSRMVAERIWADTDDYRLIDSLYRLDASCVEDVDWDVLVDNREGNLCKKRWNQMVLHIGHHQNKSFSEQVEVLAQRYCPVLLGARESWDSKPRVDLPGSVGSKRDVG